MSNSEQCSNRFEFDLISLLVNFSYELGQIMARFDFLCPRWVIMSNVQTDFQLDLISILVNFSCELGQIGGSFEKKSLCSELERKFYFLAIQNLVDIKSSRFWWYSFVFERKQCCLVFFWSISCGQKANYKWWSYQADRPLVLKMKWWHHNHTTLFFENEMITW